jgi:hypothetical protein
MSFFKIVVKRENTTYYATTFFEKITSNPKAFDNEILKGKGYLIA